MIPGLFITGTDTEVGKTYVAALIARALFTSGKRVGIYKPVASGCRKQVDELVSDDALALWEAAGKPGTIERVCPQRFAAPLAPHLAARAEGRAVDPGLLRTGVQYWQSESDVVLVEGAGGLMSPLSDEDYNADLAQDLGYPLLVVVPNELGAINQTLQTLITASTFRGGLNIAGIVLNHVRPSGDDESIATNRAELEARCVPPLLGEVAFNATTFDEPVDWLSVAALPLGRDE